MNNSRKNFLDKIRRDEFGEDFEIRKKKRQKKWKSNRSNKPDAHPEQLTYHLKIEKGDE